MQYLLCSQWLGLHVHTIHKTQNLKGNPKHQNYLDHLLSLLEQLEVYCQKDLGTTGKSDCESEQ